jgi:segregation and condensation protein A
MEERDYEVKLEIFEGPLDLLVHLIHKNEVDIFDIPIATITDQYLAYIEMAKALNVNLAGDFLIMASTLVHIKSRMLLPELRGEEEEEDPRVEITRPLLEYMRFKELSEALADREILDRDVFTRRPDGEWVKQLKEEGPQYAVNLFQLAEAFRRVVERSFPGIQLSFRLEKWSVKEMTERLIATLREKPEIYFHELFGPGREIGELVATFLALLELVHSAVVRVFQADLEGDILLIACFEESSESDGNPAQVDH